MPSMYSDEELDALDIVDCLGLPPLQADLMRLVRQKADTDGVASISLSDFLPWFHQYTLQELDNAFHALEKKGRLTRFPDQSLVRPRVHWGDPTEMPADGLFFLRSRHYTTAIRRKAT